MNIISKHAKKFQFGPIALHFITSRIKHRETAEWRNGYPYCWATFRHILGARNSDDSVSSSQLKMLWSRRALCTMPMRLMCGRGGYFYVRVPEKATESEVQEALTRIFRHIQFVKAYFRNVVQFQDNKSDQNHSELRFKSPRKRVKQFCHFFRSAQINSSLWKFFPFSWKSNIYMRELWRG